MMIRSRFLVVILFVWLSSIYAKSKDSHLPAVIDSLTKLSRLVNGLEIVKDLHQANDYYVYFELLKMNKEQGEAVAQRKDFNKTKELIETLISYTRTLPQSSVKNFGELTEGLEIMSSFLDESAVLSTLQSVLEDPFDKFIDTLKPFKKLLIEIHTDFNLKLFENFVSALEDIISGKTSDINQAVNDFMPALRKIRSSKAIHTWKSHSGALQQIVQVAGVVEEYMANFGKLTALRTELGKMSADVKSVLPIAKESGRMEELSGALKSISESVERMNGPMGARELTVGLPGGTGDLEEIFKDLDGKWMKETIAGGKDLGKLKKLLEPLKTFTEGVKKVEGLWRNVSGHPGIQKALDLSADLHMTSESGKLVGSADPTTAMQAVANCLGSLKPITPIDLTQFNDFSNLCIQVDKAIETINPTSKKILNEESALLKLSAGTSQEDLKNVKKKFEDFAEILESFSVLKSESLSKMNNPGLLSVIQSSLVTSNLTVALDCLQKISEMDKVGKFLKFGDSAEMITNKLGDTKDVVEFLKSVMDMKKTLGEVSGVGKKTLRRRRRASGGLEDLKNSKQLSIDLGRGVMALKKLEDVRKHQKTVLEVASCGDKVDNLIRTLPQVSALWTTDNKDGMTDMVKGINDLDKKCSSLLPHDLLNLSSVFDLAADIRSVPIPSQLFSDPIATSLRSSSDPELQKSADSFQSVSALQLDFANQLSDLRAASATVLPIRNFFDNMFGVVRVQAAVLQHDSSTSPVEKSDMLLFCVGSVVAVLVLSGVLVFVIIRLKPHRSSWFLKMKYSDEDLNKLLIRSSRHLSFVEMRMKVGEYVSLMDSVMKNDYDATKKFVGLGAWINACSGSDSLLHIAVKNKNPDIVRLLIRHGADMSFKNENGWTAKELCMHLMKSTKSTSEIAKFKEIIDCMEKLRRKRWIRVLPSLLPVSEYRIYVDEAVRNAEFVNLFEDLLTPTRDAATHIVVKTDENGTYEVDAEILENLQVLVRPALIMRVSWLEDCVKDRKNLERDYKFRVKEVKFEGKTFGNMEEMNMLFHLPTVSPLYGFRCHYISWPGQVICKETQRDEKAKGILKMLGASDTPRAVGSSRTPFHFPQMLSNLHVYSLPGKYYSNNVLDALNSEHLCLAELVQLIFRSTTSGATAGR